MFYPFFFRNKSVCRCDQALTDKKSFYPFISVLCSFLIRWIRSLSGDVRWCPFRPVWSFEHVQKFPSDITDRDASLMDGRYVASVRGDEFCHRITKYCIICLFSLRNKSVCRSDQALKHREKTRSVWPVSWKTHTEKIVLIENLDIEMRTIRRWIQLNDNNNKKPEPRDRHYFSSWAKCHRDTDYPKQIFPFRWLKWFW